MSTKGQESHFLEACAQVFFLMGHAGFTGVTATLGATHMELNVRLFALYRERAGRNTIPVTVADGATVGDLTAEIRHQLPNLAPPEVKIVVAVNADYAEHDVILQPGDDVCLIPPVSGG